MICHAIAARLLQLRYSYGAAGAKEKAGHMSQKLRRPKLPAASWTPRDTCHATSSLELHTRYTAAAMLTQRYVALHSLVLGDLHHLPTS